MQRHVPTEDTFMQVICKFASLICNQTHFDRVRTYSTCAWFSPQARHTVPMKSMRLNEYFGDNIQVLFLY
jgi:hypothetical protein